MYISNDPFIKTEDRRIGSNEFHHVVGDGLAVTNLATVSMPSPIVPGTDYLGAIADFEEWLVESNEVNNTRLGTPAALRTNQSFYRVRLR